jgi:predicted GNAT family acetyltransferase
MRQEELEFTNDPIRFNTEVAEPLMHAGAMPNNMVLGLAHSATTAQKQNPDYLGLVIRQEGRLSAACLQTKQGWILLSQCEAAAVRTLLDAWIEKAGKPIVIFAPEPSITVAENWVKEKYGMVRAAETINLAYELTAVTLPTRPVAGKMRIATESDLTFLPEWELQFVVDCNMPQQNEPDFREHCLKNMEQFVKNKVVALWEADGEPVAMCRSTRKAPFATSVAGVYTPQDFRGKGYASHLVAALSQQLLNEGAPRCLLFTDAANPTSNGIYQRIGYRYCCDFRRIDF